MGAWLNDFEEEILSFPNGAHDDMTDCFSHAVTLIVSKKREGKFDLSGLIRPIDTGRRSSFGWH